MAMQAKPRREALVIELARYKEKNRLLLAALQILSDRPDDVQRRARDLYDHGWSNARIAESLDLPLLEVRKMTR